MHRELTLIGLCLFMAMPVWAQERIELQGDTVHSNQDAPKALYIVPWRSMSPLTMDGLKIDTMVDEQLEPVDPVVFRRRVQLHKITEKASAQN